MNAKKGEYNGIFDTVRQVLRHDKLGIKILLFSIIKIRNIF